MKPTALEKNAKPGKDLDEVCLLRERVKELEGHTFKFSVMGLGYMVRGDLESVEALASLITGLID